MKEVAKKFLRFKVGDGTQIHLWLDNWHPNGVLEEKYGYRVVYDSRSKLDAKLFTIMLGKEWNWPPASSEDLVKIQSNLSVVKIGDKDRAFWVTSKNKCYTSRDSWEEIRNRSPKVESWRLVWFSLPIPKQAFILCLAIRNGLTTGEKQASWGCRGEVQCNRSCMECIEHLFFNCGYSKRLRQELMRRNLVLDPPST